VIRQINNRAIRIEAITELTVKILRLLGIGNALGEHQKQETRMSQAIDSKARINYGEAQAQVIRPAKANRVDCQPCWENLP